MRLLPLRRANRARPARKFRFIFIGLILVVLVLGWRFLSTSSWLAIGSVQVQGDPKGYVTTDIRQDLLGQNILTASPPNLSKIASGSAIEKITLQKSFPGSVTAIVTYRTPLYSWQTSRGRYLVDATGLAYTNAASEPVIEVTDLTSSIGLGEKVDAWKIAILAQLMQATSGTYSVLTTSFSGVSLTAVLTSGTQVYLSGSGDLNQIRSALQLILSKAKIDGRLPRTIDLRYQQPVVTY